MAKVLLIGDPHLKINKFDLAVRFLNWLNELIAQQKPDLVINLGDTWDTHSVLRSEVACEFMNHIYKVIDLKIPYVYLVGNHDCYKPNDSKYHAMLPYKNKIKGLHVVDEVTDLYGMTFVPYIHDSSKFPKTSLPVCIAHQTFKGADFGNIVTKDGVDPSEVKGAELIVSGHIHKKQQLNVGATSVLYVGSPFSQSASDIDQIKGITVLDSETYSTSFYECPLPMWRKLTAELTVQNSINSVISDIEQQLKSFPKDHWVMEITGPKAEVSSLLASKEYKTVIKDINITVKTAFNDNEKKKVAIEAKSMEHILSEYVNKVYSGTLDKEELIKRAKLILSESRSYR